MTETIEQHREAESRRAAEVQRQRVDGAERHDELVREAVDLASRAARAAARVTAAGNWARNARKQFKRDTSIREDQIREGIDSAISAAGEQLTARLRSVRADLARGTLAPEALAELAGLWTAARDGAFAKALHGLATEPDPPRAAMVTCRLTGEDVRPRLAEADRHGATIVRCAERAREHARTTAHARTAAELGQLEDLAGARSATADAEQAAIDAEDALSAVRAALNPRHED